MRTKSIILLPVFLVLAGLLLIWGLLVSQARQLQLKADDLAEGVRVTLINLDGEVVYDTEGGPLPNHAGRAEFEAAKNGKPQRTIVRKSETLQATTLYHARRVGDYVVRIAIPYQSAIETRKIIQRGFFAAGLSGAYVIIVIFMLARAHLRRLRLIATEREAHRKRIEEMMEREAFRREFLSNVTHEIKTPVTGIQGAVELLQEEGLSPKEQARLFQILQGQTKRLNALVEDVLALSRLERDSETDKHEWEAHDLADIVRSAIELAQPAAKRAGVELQAETESVIRLCDDHAVEDAVSNLLDNAIRYSGSNRVLVRVYERDDGKGEISVSDDGIGIPLADQPRIFERFYRVDKDRSREKGGTGLGLAIVKHVARLHGGDVTVVSRPGEGCIFTIVL